MASGPLSADEAPTISARMSAGGVSRYAAERWGMAKAVVGNRSSEPQDALVVVTPPGSDGVQFARNIRVPADCSIETIWPIWINKGVSGNLDFEFLVFPGGAETEIIKRRENQEVLSSYSALVRADGVALSAWLASADASDEDNNKVQRLMRAMKFAVHRDAALVSMVPREITGHSECLDMIDQLVISHRELEQLPEACRCIRLWVQRGGRLLVCMDQTGPAALEQLLGEAFPFAVVGETSNNRIELKLNPEYRTDSYPVREVIREFDEPVRYVRIVADQAEPIWTVDGWPVALQVPVGLGDVVVTTISSDVFYEQKLERKLDDAEFQPIASMRKIQDALFVISQPHTLNPEIVGAQAAAQIGYAIPARSFALLITLGFPLLLLCAGTILLKSHKGERLIWLVPLLAVMLSIPAISKATASKSVAPSTAIQTQIVHAVPGQTEVVSDGLATVYAPDPAPQQVTGSNGAILEPPVDESNRDYRRIVWTGNQVNHWQNMTQPKGISSMVIRGTRRLQQPLQSIATFTADGLAGQLQTGELNNARNAIFAGMNPDLMAAEITEDGRFFVAPTALLSEGEFFENALVNDEQRQQANIYSGIFDKSAHDIPFPSQPSILYWADAQDSAIKIGAEDTVRQELLLVTQPIRLVPPALDQPITIPSAFISYRAVVDDNGSFSSVFNASKRMWDTSGREGQGSVRLQFDLPKVCLPLQTTSAKLRLRIRAGSRTVDISVGQPGSFQSAEQLNSPVGAFEIEIPVDAVQDVMRTGKLWMHIDVSDIVQAESDEPAVGEQDDSWVIEQLSLTVTGHRTAN